MTPGNTANKSGKNAEAIISCVMDILRKKGYKPVREMKLPKLKDKPIFSNGLRADFLVRCLPQYEEGLIISSKRQDSDGTATEKLYYHIKHVIKECYPYPTILVMTGGVWSEEAKLWAKRQVDGIKLVDVFFTYEELLIWAENVPSRKSGSEKFTYIDLPLWSDDA